MVRYRPSSSWRTKTGKIGAPEACAIRNGPIGDEVVQPVGRLDPVGLADPVDVLATVKIGTEVGERRFVSPALGAAIGRAKRYPSPFQRTPTLVVVAKERDPVLRPAPSRVRTE
jgi:hypothetical protein